jgi:hypothetical protein
MAFPLACLQYNQLQIDVTLRPVKEHLRTTRPCTAIAKRTLQRHIRARMPQHVIVNIFNFFIRIQMEIVEKTILVSHILGGFLSIYVANRFPIKKLVL